MTMKELLRFVGFDKVNERIHAIYYSDVAEKNKPKVTAAYQRVWDELMRKVIPPCEPAIFFAVDTRESTDDDWGPDLYYVLSSTGEDFAPMGSPWGKMLSYDVSAESISEIGAETICAGFMYLITFYDWSEEGS